MNAADFRAWAERIFGSWDAYRASLRDRHWVPTANGYSSHSRNACDQSCAVAEKD